MLPWEYNPEFAQERLIKMGNLIARGRMNAVDRSDPSIGDDSWTLGVCAYSYSCYEIKSAAETPGFEWLKIIDGSKHFQFSIGGVPMRFWRGDFDNPASKIREATITEQLRFDFGVEENNANIVYRIFVEGDVDGLLLRAAFVALHEGRIDRWPIPLTKIDNSIVLMDDKRPSGIELLPPPVGDAAGEGAYPYIKLRSEGQK